MKRFSISFNEEEYRKLVEIREWYEGQTGLRISKCAMIKRLLFDLEHKESLTELKSCSK